VPSAVIEEHPHNAYIFLIDCLPKASVADWVTHVATIGVLLGSSVSSLQRAHSWSWGLPTPSAMGRSTF